MLLDLIVVIGFLIVIALVLIAHRKRITVQAEVKAVLARTEAHLKAKP